MKKYFFLRCLLLFVGLSFGQSVAGLEQYVDKAQYDKNSRLFLLRLKSDPVIKEAEVPTFIATYVFEKGPHQVELFKTEKDAQGFTHKKYRVLQNGVVVNNKIIMAHCRNGQLVSLNGDLYVPQKALNHFLISEQAALQAALKSVNAQRYKWENKAAEKQMQEALHQPDFTYFPKALKTIYEKAGRAYCSYRFDIYAEQPLLRAYVFVDATTGQVLGTQNRICNLDVPGTMATKYSGTQTVTIDQNGSTYRMRESGRGLGIFTFNSNYAAVQAPNDFTSTSVNWTGVNADQGARDAHWGAEMWYDYFLNTYNRNSIDNAGYPLVSFVHFGNNFPLAFWDGAVTCYGDGSPTSGFDVFTALDVCAHEVTHGLTENTGNMVYQDEPGALNESYSDIFGVCVDRYARPTNWNWTMTEEVSLTGAPVRSFINPNQCGQPDTYRGNYWALGPNDAGGVHTNSGVSNYWFYLLSSGGSGTNDLGNSYSVSAIGVPAAANIAFRALTVYFSPSTNFRMARELTIQAAEDLYGSCSNAVFQTINAWHAVGLGSAYVPGQVSPAFVADFNERCSAPATVKFFNATPYASSCLWNFGDGSTSTLNHPVHTYNSAGMYTVSLKATSCNLTDSIVQPDFIKILIPTTPSVSAGSRCDAGTVTLSATGNGQISWLAAPGASVTLASGTLFTTPVLNTNTTYYARNSISYTPVFGGMPSNTGGGYSAGAVGDGLMFEAYKNCILNSVVVYAQSAGNMQIEIYDQGSGSSTTFSYVLSAGANTVTLNYPVLTGGTYWMTKTTAVNLYRSLSGFTFPYTIGGMLAVASASDQKYYWFYNLKVSQPGCSSAPVAVTASVQLAPQLTVSASQSTVCVGVAAVALTGQPAGGTFSGTGVSGVNFLPHALSPGTYSVVYTLTYGSGCSVSEELGIRVDACAGLYALQNTNDWTLCPNPASREARVFTANHPEGRHLVLYDALGRELARTPLTVFDTRLDLAAFASGVYVLNVVDGQGRVLKTWKLVKHE